MRAPQRQVLDVLTASDPISNRKKVLYLDATTYLVRSDATYETTMYFGGGEIFSEICLKTAAAKLGSNAPVCSFYSHCISRPIEISPFDYRLRMSILITGSVKTE